MRSTTTLATALLAATAVAGVGLVGTAQAAEVRADKGCGGSVYAGPAGGHGEQSGGRSVWGARGDRQQYQWSVQGDFGKVNIWLRGFNGEHQETWTWVGLWDAGSQGRTLVDWGDVAATPAIRVETPKGPFPGLFVDWKC